MFFPMIFVLVLAVHESAVVDSTAVVSTLAPMPDFDYLSCCPGHGKNGDQYHYVVPLEGGGWRCGGPGTTFCIYHSTKSRALKHCKNICRDGGGCK